MSDSGGLKPVKPTPGTIGASATWSSPLPQMPSDTAAMSADLGKVESGEEKTSYSQPLLGDSYGNDSDANRNTRAKSIDSVVSFTSNVSVTQGERIAANRPLCCCSYLLPCSRYSCWHRERRPQEKKACYAWACGGLSALTVVLLVLTFTLFIPATIQSVVDDSTFEFGVLNMTDAVGDTVRLTSRSTIKCRAMPLSATLSGNHVDFEYKAPSGWLTIGTIAMTDIKIPSNTAKVHADLKQLLVHIKHRDHWDAFTVATLNEDQVKWRVRGTIKVTASLAGINLAYHHVKISKSIVTKAMGGLTNVKVLSYDATTTDRDSLPIQIAKIKVYNPSTISIQPLGQLMTQVYSGRSSMGWMRSTTNVSMYTGDNVLELKGPLNPDNITQLNHVLSAYLTGEGSPIVAQVSNYTASPGENDDYFASYVPAVTVPLYETAASALAMNLNLKYPAGKLNITTESIVDARVRHLIGDPSHVPLWIGILNPFSAEIYLKETNFDVYWTDPGITPSGTNNVFGATPFGYVQNTGLDIAIAGMNTTLTGTTADDALTLTVPLSEEATAMVEQLSLGRDATGYIYIGLKGYFILQMGSLTMQLNYWQAMNVPSCDLTTYSQVQPDGGLCDNPPSNVITDSYRDRHVNFRSD